MLRKLCHFRDKESRVLASALSLIAVLLGESHWTSLVPTPHEEISTTVLLPKRVCGSRERGPEEVQGMRVAVAKGLLRGGQRTQRPALGRSDIQRIPQSCWREDGFGTNGTCSLTVYHWLGNSLLGLEKTQSMKSRLQRMPEIREKV